LTSLPISGEGIIANFAEKRRMIVFSLPTVNHSKGTLVMSKDWIIDVLTDLRAFAHLNELPSLAEHLDDTVLVAAAELAENALHRQNGTVVYDATTRNISGQPHSGLKS